MNHVSVDLGIELNNIKELFCPRVVVAAKQFLYLNRVSLARAVIVADFPQRNTINRVMPILIFLGFLQGEPFCSFALDFPVLFHFGPGGTFRII